MIIERSKWWAGLVWLLMSIAGCSGLGGEPSIIATLPPRPTAVVQTVQFPESPPDLSLGGRIFADNCTRCHGMKGKGDGELVQSGQVPGLMDFTDSRTSQDTTPLEWYEVVTNGRLDKLMPPWNEKLTDDQRWSVTMYVYTLAGTPELLADGESIWAEKCSECHGPAGEGIDSGTPLPELWDVTTTQILTTLNTGIPDKMQSFTSELSSDELVAVSLYTRQLSLVGVGDSTQEVAAAPTVATQNVTLEPVSTEESALVVTGDVSGKVVNQSAGGTIPAGLTIKLHIIDDQNSNTSEPANILSTTVDTDGNYQFENVEVVSGWQYLVTVEYQKVLFNSDIVDGNPDSPRISLPLSIYEVSDDPSNIEIDGMLLMLRSNIQSGELEGVQIVSFNNTSDRVFLRADSDSVSSVSVLLPTGAVFQDFSEGTYVVSTDGTEITDTQPILPGNPHVMHIGYRLPYSGNITLEQAVKFDLNGQVEVLVPDDGLAINESEFTALGSRQLGDNIFFSYGATLNRKAGESIRVPISSKETPIGSTTNIISPVAYLLIAVGLLAVGLAAGFLIRGRTASSAPVTNPDSEVDRLIGQIAELDILYQNGKITKAKYQGQRKILKEHVALLKKGNELS